MSTAFQPVLPFEVQMDLVRTIIGCENAEIMRPAYAVEYDFSHFRHNCSRRSKPKFAEIFFWLAKSTAHLDTKRQVHKD
jgi:tRNA U34 5-carboxymethylaminomethyl modifying enzyme MnmG/GidA